MKTIALGYAGTNGTRSSCYDITERVDLYDMEYIVELCGTSAMSYYIHTLHPLEFKYVLNDNNQHLIELYNILKDESQWKYL
jgi:site-specific DNA-adenine methylase